MQVDFESLPAYTLHGMGKRIDWKAHEGKRFGKLTLHRWIGKQHFECICDCANGMLPGKRIYYYDMTQPENPTVSCGCHKYELNKTRFENERGDEVGKVYYDCTVLRTWCDTAFKTRADILCFCGNVFEINLNSLKNGQIRSCTCLKNLPPGIAARNTIIASYRGKAQDKGREWTLTDEQCIAMFEANCHYCGAAPYQSRTIAWCKGAYLYNGIDRMNNDLGYLPDNCVSCCPKCNQLKLSLPWHEWQTKMQRIANIDFSSRTFDYTLYEVSAKDLKTQQDNYFSCKNNTKNKVFELTLLQYYHLATKSCFYCDSPPQNFVKRDSKAYYQGIDRIDNSTGYVFENCLPCCRNCNTSKNKYHQTNFIQHLQRLSNFLRPKPFVQGTLFELLQQ